MSITTLYTTGVHQEVITFASDEERVAWDQEVFAIKAESSRIFNQREAEGLTTNIRVLYQAWMDRIKTFKDTFGENRVPMDIKWALNSAQEGLEVEVTQWENPPNKETFEN